MRKHCNTISKYFSLLSNHIHDVNEFSKQINFWIESDAEDIYYEALSDDLFKADLITFPQKVIKLAQKTRNTTNFYLEELYSFFGVLKLLMKLEQREDS
jgi:hypothetical protein